MKLPLRIFVSSVQKELAAERSALRDYLSGDVLMRRCREAGLREPEIRIDHDVWITTIWRKNAAGAQSTDPVLKVVQLLAIEGELGPSEIQERLGLKHSPTFRENYLRPAMDKGMIERTIPDKPNSRLQKYRLTDRGRTLLKEKR
jgi:ATP-dependent DNA helicase RecG